MLHVWTEGHDEFISDSYAAIINYLKNEIERLGGIIKLEEEVTAIEVVDGISSPPHFSLLYRTD
jgi:phytoene dehydrogenase-like protein